MAEPDMDRVKAYLGEYIKMATPHKGAQRSRCVSPSPCSTEAIATLGWEGSAETLTLSISSGDGRREGLHGST